MKKKKLYIIVILSTLLLSLSGLAISQSINKEDKIRKSKSKIEEVEKKNNSSEEKKDKIDSSEEKENSNLEVKEEVIDNKKESITTKYDNKKTEVISNQQIKKDEIGTTENKENLSNNDSSNNSSSSNNSNNSNNTSSENKPTEPEVVVPVTPTPEEKNDAYRKQLQNKYGIKIAYGNELGNYSATGVMLTKMTDPNTINEYLNKINNVLSLYPDGFFKEFINYNINLTIYLVDAVGNGQYAGLLDSRVTSDVKLTIRKYLLFERTLHHELFHYIDVYLKQKMNPNNIESLWNTLNPIGYTYGTAISSYTYSGSSGAYFINDYSQTNYKEDRATLFADMMSRTVKTTYMNEGEPILLKMRRIAEEIDTCFQTVTSYNNEHWERFIY